MLSWIADTVLLWLAARRVVRFGQTMFHRRDGVYWYVDDRGDIYELRPTWGTTGPFVITLLRRGL